MLYVSAPVAAEAMDEWVLDDYAAKHRVAIDRLLQLRVFVETHESGSLPREPMPSNVSGRLLTLAELEGYALEQWECFLLRLINSSQVERGTSFSRL